MTSFEALRTLGDAARSGDARVQRAAAHALAEAQARMGGRR